MTDTGIQVVDEKTGELVELTAGQVARLNTPRPIHEEIQHYRQIQEQLDRALPDCVMKIQGRTFRKKSYWRAIATAFRVSVEIQEERREVFDGDVVWFVVALATDASGRSMSGDGACAMSEKRGAMATEHNVRSHAITRAKNRAVSDLVGFGEVSAEELGPQSFRDDRAPDVSHWEPVDQPRGGQASPPLSQTLSDEQVQRLQAELAMKGKKESALLEFLGKDSIWSITQDERQAAWGWITRP